MLLNNQWAKETLKKKKKKSQLNKTLQSRQTSENPDTELLKL